MNALFVSNDPSVFDFGSATRARMRAYAAAIGELHIVSRGRGTETHDGALHLYPVHRPRLLAMGALMRRARRVIKEHDIDVVSAQDPFEHGWAAWRAVRGTRAKLHIQVHTDFLTPWFTRGHIARSPRVRMPFLNHVRRRIAKRVLPHADAIRAVSRRVRDSLIAAYGTRIPEPSVIPISVPTDTPEPVQLPPHPFTFALIAVGRLEPEKRVEDVLAAVAQLKDSYPSLGTFIVGEGREREKLERMARRLGIGERIIFLGARPDARGLMRSAQAFIQASAYEGYGITLIEAALARIPIITTDVGIVGEVFEGYREVLEAPVGDPTNLAAHIAWLIEDHAARTQLIMSAEAKARAHLAATDSSPAAIARDLARALVPVQAAI